jgi:hypothetical protein
MSNTGWQASSIDIQFLRSANKSLSHVHIHLLLLLLLSAFSWPGASDPAPYSSHPYPPTPVTLSPVPPHYTPYSSHPIPYTRQLTPVILYRARVQCRTSYTVDPKPQALDPAPLALKPYYFSTSPSISRASRSAHRVCDSSPILCRGGAGNSPAFLVWKHCNSAGARRERIEHEKRIQLERVESE